MLKCFGHQCTGSPIHVYCSCSRWSLNVHPEWNTCAFHVGKDDPLQGCKHKYAKRYKKLESNILLTHSCNFFLDSAGQCQDFRHCPIVHVYSRGTLFAFQHPSLKLYQYCHLGKLKPDSDSIVPA